MRLTDKAISGLTTYHKPYKRYGGNGLYLEVRPTGAKLWRFRFKFEGKAKLLVLGEFPAVGLKDALTLQRKMEINLTQSRPLKWIQDTFRYPGGFRPRLLRLFCREGSMPSCLFSLKGSHHRAGGFNHRMVPHNKPES